MVSTTKITDIYVKRTPLRQLIQQMPNPTKENIKKLYGDIGVDIFEGKDKITILAAKNNKQTKNFINKISEWWKNERKFDYEEKDSINDLVLKHACNKSFGSIDEIEEKFGEEGKRAAEIFKFMGYLNTGI